jgi:hypothetical protein
MAWHDLAAFEARKADLLREAEQYRLAKLARKAQGRQYPSLLDALKYRLLTAWPKRESKATRKIVTRARGGRVLVVE